MKIEKGNEIDIAAATHALLGRALRKLILTTLELLTILAKHLTILLELLDIDRLSVLSDLLSMLRLPHQVIEGVALHPLRYFSRIFPGLQGPSSLLQRLGPVALLMLVEIVDLLHFLASRVVLDLCCGIMYGKTVVLLPLDQ